MSENVIEVDLYNMNHTKAGRMPGVYLDDEENIAAEKARARVEDREPELDDIDTLPPSAGTQLRPFAALADSHPNHGNVQFNEDLVKPAEPVATAEIDLNENVVKSDETTTDGSVPPAESGAAESDSGSVEDGTLTY